MGRHGADQLDDKNGDGELVKKTECGWVPPGLKQTRLWNGRADEIKLSHLFAGTVLGPGQTARGHPGHSHGQGQ
jgi:hypothetical protein